MGHPALSLCLGWGTEVLFGLRRGLLKGDDFHIADTGWYGSGGSGGGVKGQALAGGGGVDEVGEDGFTVFGKDFDGVVVHHDFNWN